MTPSICGSFLSDQRSLISFTWTLTTVLALVSFFVAGGASIQTHTSYQHLVQQYEYEYRQQQYQQQQGEGGEQHNSGDNRWQAKLQLNALQSHSIPVIAGLALLMVLGLTLYGSTALVGFTSLRGVYIAPCFASQHSRLQWGLFGGCLLFGANLLLLCAVILGEVRVNVEEQDVPYEVERLATIVAVLCLFLSAIYTIFSVVLFWHLGKEGDDDVKAVEPTTRRNDSTFLTVGRK